MNSEILYKQRIISKKNVPLKVLGEGDFKHKIEITANKFSKSAIEKIEKNGGKATVA